MDEKLKSKDANTTEEHSRLFKKDFWAYHRML